MNFITQDFLFIFNCIAIGIFAVLLTYWLLNRSPFSQWFQASGDIVASFIGVPAFLFGLAVSTFTASVINDHNAAKTSLINETSAVRSILRISKTLPLEERTKLTSTMDDYVNSIVKIEWPLMLKGQTADISISTPLDKLTVVSESISSNHFENRSTGSRLESAIEVLHRERLERLLLAHEVGSFSRMPSIFILSLLMLLTIGLLQLREPKAMRISLVMGALCIGSSMVFIFLNLSPYRGPTSIQPMLLEKSIVY